MNLLTSVRAYLLTFSVGIVGALLALFLSFPIPWLIGSLIACAVLSFTGVAIKTLPNFLERWMRVAIGVSLGPSVASSLQLTGADLPFAIGAALVVTTLTVVCGTRWFESRAGLPRPAAFMSALPGGLSMLLALAGDIGNRAQVILLHAVRIVIVVVSISLLARALGIPPEPTPLLASLEWHNGTSPWLLAALIITCFFLAEKLNIAGGHVIVPMIISACIVAFTDISIAPPMIVKTSALLVFGIVIGCEVAKGPRNQYFSLFAASTIFTVVIMASGAMFALLLTKITELEFLVLFLALAPGGIAEVSLVALALGLDAGLVALVHSCRFIYIILAGPIGLKVLQKREKDKSLS